ncbi:hypothetical protein AeRB84_005248 [Aphanomyces euteiches]|nr:hypothetical protein AeRB84_012340 [Aphanomyces euteiches]KAH9152300.1 hypothetical protein AeRB84_005248 [Aphanomyces euteiches]
MHQLIHLKHQQPTPAERSIYFTFSVLPRMTHQTTSYDDMSDFLKDAMFTFDDHLSSDNDDMASMEGSSPVHFMKTTADSMDNNEKSASYLERLYGMLEECSPSIATWIKDGAAFAIVDLKAFESVYLPQYFNAIKFDSFCRQLNSYRFQRVKAGGAFEFSHPEFIRGHVERLGVIQRRRRVRKLNAKAIDRMSESEVRSTLTDVISFVNTMQAELDETKALVRSMIAERQEE